MISFSFDESNGILKLKYTNNITLEDYQQLFIKLKEANNYLPFPKNLKVLSDYREAKIEFLPENLKEIWAHIKQTFDIIETIKEAFVHSNPYETALSVISSENEYDSRYAARIFAKEENAIEWLNS